MSFYRQKIEEINEDLRGLGWIENVYDLARTGVDSEGTFPEVYNNDGTNYSTRALPHGKAMSFFTVNSSTQIDETEYYETELSLVVWADLTKVYSKPYDYTEELILEVKNVLNKHDAYNYSIDFEDVFNDYEQLDKLTNQNTMLPFTAFRINFTVSLLLCF